MLNACNVGPQVQANIFGGTLWHLLNEQLDMEAQH
jgi:hypothetical protein